jgi:hypothetical protein
MYNCGTANEKEMLEELYIAGKRYINVYVFIYICKFVSLYVLKCIYIYDCGTANEEEMLEKLYTAGKRLV